MIDPEFDEPPEEDPRERRERAKEEEADRIYDEIKNGDRPRPYWWPESWKSYKHDPPTDDDPEVK